MRKMKLFATSIVAVAVSVICLSPVSCETRSKQPGETKASQEPKNSNVAAAQPGSNRKQSGSAKSLLNPFKNHSPEWLRADRMSVVTDPRAADDRIEAFFRKLGVTSIDVGEDGLYTLLFPEQISVEKVRWKKMSIVLLATPSTVTQFEHELKLDDKDEHRQLLVTIPADKSAEEVKSILSGAGSLTVGDLNNDQLIVTTSPGHLIEGYRYITSFGLQAKQK